MMSARIYMELNVPEEIIEKRIYWIRGQKVMLDCDLAELYGVKTKVLNQSVKRNLNRFPEDFMFALTREEIQNWSQFVTSSQLKHSQGVKAFTEQGVAMLSSILRSKQAVQVNIAIMRAFVKLRQLLSSHKKLAQKFSELEKKIETHDDEIRAIFDAIQNLMTHSGEEQKRSIGFHPVEN